MSNISPELQKQIEQEAEHYANVEWSEKAKHIDHRMSDRWDGSKEDYEAGAEPYALKWERAEQQLEQMAKALKEIRGLCGNNDSAIWNVASNSAAEYNNYKNGNDERGL